MADTKISALAAGTDLAGTEALPAVQSAATVKVTPAQIKTYTSTTPTFTGQVTITGGTITTSQPLTLTQTWNAAGVTFNSLLVNVTSTASAAASRFVDFQLAGVSKVRIDKTGKLIISTGASVNDTLEFGGTQSHVISYNSNAVGTHFRIMGDSSGSGGAAYYQGGSGMQIQWNNATGLHTGAIDTAIGRTSAGILEVTTGTPGTLATIRAKLRTYANAVAEVPTATHTLRLFDLAGTEYKVLAVAA